MKVTPRAVLPPILPDDRKPKKSAAAEAQPAAAPAGWTPVNKLSKPVTPYLVSVGSGGNRYDFGKGVTSDNTGYGIIGRSFQSADGKTAKVRIEAKDYPENKAKLDQLAATFSDGGMTKEDARWVRNTLTPMLSAAANAPNETEKAALEKQATDAFVKYLIAR